MMMLDGDVDDDDKYDEDGLAPGQHVCTVDSGSGSRAAALKKKKIIWIITILDKAKIIAVITILDKERFIVISITLENIFCLTIQ